MALSKSDRDHNSSVLALLQTGDLVEFPRGNYSHWAVYAGNNKVIHLGGVGNDGVDAKSRPEHVFTICGKQYSKAEVRMDDFWDVVGSCRACRNNNKDSSWGAFNPQEILRRARSYLGRVGYNLITSNCEHFAKWCRYDKWKSDQVDNVLTSLAIGGAVALGIGAIAALARSFRSNEAAAGYDSDSDSD